MCNKPVGTYPFSIQIVPKCYKTQEMCDKVIPIKAFMLKYCLNRFKMKKLCDNSVVSYLLALKFVSDWFFTNKMIEKLDNGVFSNDDIIFGDIDSDIVEFFSNGP